MPIELSHDHVAIRAVDYAGTLAWYQDKLDFTVDQEWPFGDMQQDTYLAGGTMYVLPARRREQVAPGSHAHARRDDVRLRPRVGNAAPLRETA
jgi:catechol 2,3-dioxygenase-like lactoylglutathione lyase family enzyme